MPASNEEVIRAALEAWNRRDLETVAKLLHPDFERVEVEESPAHAGAPRVGKSAVERVTEDLDDGFTGYAAENRRRGRDRR